MKQTLVIWIVLSIVAVFSIASNIQSYSHRSQIVTDFKSQLADSKTQYTDDLKSQRIELEEQLLRIESGKVYGSTKTDPDWRINEGKAKDQRSFQKRIVFDPPFSNIPEVIVGISRLNVADATNPKIQISAENLSSEGFDLVFATWHNSEFHSLEANWLAFGKQSQDEQKDSPNSDSAAAKTE